MHVRTLCIGRRAAAHTGVPRLFRTAMSVKCLMFFASRVDALADGNDRSLFRAEEKFLEMYKELHELRQVLSESLRV